MNAAKFSAFTLERYRLGELSPEDTQMVINALATNEELNIQIKDMEESDRELKSLYPAEYFGLNKNTREFTVVKSTRPTAHSRTAFVIGLAALLAIGIIVPVLFLLLRDNSGRAGNITQSELSPASGIAVTAADRPKGILNVDASLSVYLKGREIPLNDQAILTKGNTVQLAYTAPAGSEYYGMIFSIDGRSVVTMHYPYRSGQTSLLTSGRHTFLREAYTLDDAPYYEVFIMVLSDNELDARVVLGKARELAANITPAAEAIEEKSKAAFENFQVETVTVLKKDN